MSSYRIRKRLREILERLGGAPDPADEAFLREHPFPLLALLAEEDDGATAARFIASGFFPDELLKRALDELSGMSVSFRMLLSYPELARTGKAASPATWPERLKRWAVDLGATFPQTRIALSALKYAEDASLTVPSTDGATVFHPPGVYCSDFGYAAYLHMMLHCIFGHVSLTKETDAVIRDAACDIAAEAILPKLFPSMSKIAQRPPADLPTGIEPTNPKALCDYLAGLKREDLESLAAWYRRDDHSYWNNADDEAGMESANWDGLGQQLLSAAQKGAHYGLAAGSREEKALIRETARYDFSRYLRRFTTLREEMQLDMEGFDYIPYYYGLERYGNMPLIEPPETTEVSRIETLAIAVDTSGSCSVETVNRFFAEIQRILIDRENFFRRMNVHIFQCDSMIQDYRVVRSFDDWKDYREKLRIIGRGGTNFTPVFDRIEKLEAKGEIAELKGLLYFTDGDGVYPKRRPHYETAFVFTDRRFENYRIPEWIVALCLENV